MNKVRLTACIAAAALLGGSLVYYNFIDKAAESGVKKGNKCPDFAAQIYQIDGDNFSVGEEAFTLSEQIGKVCVVNFWETWCAACIQELPEFNQIQEEYEGKVEVLAVVGTTSTADYAAKWMSEKGWKALDKESEWTEFSLSFVYLPMETCTELGCSGMLPRTVIVDKSGIVAHEQDGSMTHSDLQNIIDELL